MLCQQAREILADYLGDELSEADRGVFERHLAECEHCRAEVVSLQTAVRSLQSLRPAPSTPITPMARSRRGRLRPIWQPMAYAAILLIGVGIGWFARPGVSRNAITQAPPSWSANDATLNRPDRNITEDGFVRNALALSNAFTRGKRVRSTLAPPSEALP